MLPRVDCEAIRRAVERACLSVVRFEVQLDVVVVYICGTEIGQWHCAVLSDVLVVGRMHIEFMPWLLSASRWSDS